MVERLNSKELLAAVITDASKLFSEPLNSRLYRKRFAILLAGGVNTETGMAVRPFNVDDDEIVDMIASIVVQNDSMRGILIEGVAKGIASCLASNARLLKEGYEKLNKDHDD